MKKTVLLPILMLFLITSCSRARFKQPCQDGFYPAYKPRACVVIDAGHGGEDYGTNSAKKPVTHEKDLTLTTANMLKNYLDRMGYQTIMTRNSDVFIALSQRANFANAQNPDLFVSVHYNAAPNTKANGVEVFYYETDKQKQRMEKSKELAGCVLEAICENTAARSRGVKHGNFAVIRETQMPAILVEGGFLTNEGECKKLKSAPYLKKVALGIAQGIEAYFEKK